MLQPDFPFLIILFPIRISYANYSKEHTLKEPAHNKKAPRGCFFWGKDTAITNLKSDRTKAMQLRKQPSESAGLQK